MTKKIIRIKNKTFILLTTQCKTKNKQGSKTKLSNLYKRPNILKHISLHLFFFLTHSLSSLFINVNITQHEPCMYGILPTELEELIFKCMVHIICFIFNFSFPFFLFLFFNVSLLFFLSYFPVSFFFIVTITNGDQTLTHGGKSKRFQDATSSL